MTLDSAIRRFQTSLEYRTLAASTQRAYRRSLERLDDLGFVPLHDIRRGHLRAIVEALDGKPGEAANFIAAVRRFYAYALDNEWVEANPVVGFKTGKLGAIRRWTDAEIEKMLQCSSLPLRMGVILGLYTGQRIGDVLAMRWEDIDDGAIHVVQQKTNHELWLPIHSKLQLALDTVPPVERTGPIVRRGPGDAGIWNQRSFRHRLTQEAKAMGLEGLKFHGLRKVFAARLAEAGATSSELMAAGGWRKSATVDVYTRQAEQRRLAQSAMEKLA